MRRIAILYPDMAAAWMTACLSGIRRYAQTQDGWHFHKAPSMLHGGRNLAKALRALRGWKGDGIIAASNEKSELRSIRQMGLPAVNLSGHLPELPGIARVSVDDVRAGRLAAEHLLNRGLRHLAFLGRKGVWYSQQRHRGFSQRAAESGVRCEVLLEAPFTGQPNQTWQERIGALARWVASLPRPVGILMVYDWCAHLLMEACQEAKLGIPQDVALMGMENDETICEHSDPTLTSISCNLERIGWEAAALLDRMMQGDPAPDADVLVEPEGVIARQSTGRFYCGDPLAQRALDFMMAHLNRQFNIEELADHLGVSKRTLEVRFREGLQTSPHDHLTNLRVQHAQALLQMPQKRSLRVIALESGFASESGFNAAFQRLTGESPGSFRKKRLAAKRNARSLRSAEA